MNKKELYLPEDEDLMKDSDAIGPMSTGTVLEMQKHKMAQIQLAATLRSRKTATDLDRSTTRYSLTLIFIGLIQFIAICVQLIFNFSDSNAPAWFKYLLLAGFVCFSISVMIFFSKRIKEII